MLKSNGDRIEASVTSCHDEVKGIVILAFQNQQDGSGSEAVWMVNGTRFEKVKKERERDKRSQSGAVFIHFI